MPSLFTYVRDKLCGGVGGVTKIRQMDPGAVAGDGKAEPLFETMIPELDPGSIR